jgi:hypothetical protein
MVKKKGWKNMKIRLLEVDDWKGLYLDDKLIMEGHQDE